MSASTSWRVNWTTLAWLVGFAAWLGVRASCRCRAKGGTKLFTKLSATASSSRWRRNHQPSFQDGICAQTGCWSALTVTRTCGHTILSCILGNVTAARSVHNMFPAKRNVQCWNKPCVRSHHQYAGIPFFTLKQNPISKPSFVLVSFSIIIFDSCVTSTEPNCTLIKFGVAYLQFKRTWAK